VEVVHHSGDLTKVDRFPPERWTTSTGIVDRFAPESVDHLDRNTQPAGYPNLNFREGLL
jgi:hypothetical protein